MFLRLKKCIFYSFIKSSPFLLLVPGIVLCKVLTLAEGYDVAVADIIISLLPMIFTIITIALSLPSEKIYGVSCIDFRRIRRRTCFSFLEMGVITIAIFSVYTILSIFGFTIAIWTLDFISVLYSILFITQEVPLLSHSNRFIVKLIKDAWKREKYANYKYGNNSNDMILYDIIQNLVINNGIVFSYNSFKSDEKKVNSIILDNLLSFNNDYLFDCCHNIQLISKSGSNEFKEINIITAIDMSIDNISISLTYNDDFNVPMIYNDSKKCYQISRMLFSLKNITDSLGLNEKFNTKMQSILNMLFMSLSYSNLNECEFEWSFNFLNSMLIYSISNDDLWFVRLLRDSAFNSLFFMPDRNNYYYFMSMYLYYLLEVDKRVSIVFKEKIQTFLNEKAEGLNADGSSWKSIFNHKFDFDSFDEMTNLLPNILKILGNDDFNEPWYQPKYCISWSTSDGDFSKRLIINCWLEMVIYNYKNYEFDLKLFDSMLNKLSKDEKIALATELNTKWFVDNAFKPKENIPTYLKIFTNKDTVYLPIYENDFIRRLKSFKNEFISSEIYRELDENVKTESDLIRYKDLLLKGFDESKRKISCYTKELKVENDNYLCFDALFDTRWTEELIESYGNKFYDAFKNIIKDSLLKNKDISKIPVDENNAEFIKKIYEFKYISGNFYKIRNKEVSDDVFGEITSKKKLDLWTPMCLLVKDINDIKVNFDADCGKSYVRKLFDNEIDLIIDRDYKITNGLFKYCDSTDDSRSIYISRKELFDLIKKKYFCTRIVFRKEIYINYDDAVFLDTD